MPFQPRRTQAGVTLVEQLVTTTMAALLVVLSLPGMQEAQDRQRLGSMVGQIESEMQFARSMAVARSESVRVRFVNTALGSCYVIHTGSPRACICSPSGQATCAGGGEVLRHATQPLSQGIRLQSTATEIGFDASHGMVTPTTTLQLENRSGNRVNLLLNILGRIRSCTPDPSASNPMTC